MRAEIPTCFIYVIIFQAVVCTETENEDQALRKVFEYLKRKYSDEASQEIPSSNFPGTLSTTPQPIDRESIIVDNIDEKQIALPMKIESPGLPLKNEFNKLHSLPGCDFLQNILHEAPSLPINNDIIDYFDQYASVYEDGLVTNLKPVLEYSEDYGAVAILATRKVTRLIFLERMKCPATKFDMFTIKQMQTELTKLTRDEDESMIDYLASFIYDLPNIGILGYDPNYLAHEMTKHIHAQLFNDTIDYLLGTSLIDVENFAQIFYQHLQDGLPEIATLTDELLMSELKRILRDDILYANVHCPTAVDVTRRHLDAVWDMTNGLKEVESYGLCMQVRDYLEQFVTLPSHVTDKQAKEYTEVMNDMCDYVREYVQAILNREKEYQKMVAARDALALKQFFQHYLSEDELTVLAEVLEKLHWMPNFPVTDKPPIVPDNLTGEFLPKPHVISNELQDIDFWNSYLEALTPKRFKEMDLTDFKESIRRWLNEKQTRLDAYFSMQLKNSEHEEYNSTDNDSVSSRRSRKG